MAKFITLSNLFRFKQNIDDIIPTKLSQLQNDSGFIDSSALPTKVSELENDSGFIDSSALPTKVSQLENDSNYVTSIPGEYVTETELENKDYATNTRVNEVETQIPTQVSQLENDSQYLTSVPSEYVTETKLENKDYSTNTRVNEVENSIPTRVSELENDSGYISSIPSEYVTNNDLEDKDYSTNTRVNEVENSIPTKTSDLNNDSDFIDSSSLPDMTHIITVERPSTWSGGTTFSIEKQRCSRQDGKVGEIISCCSVKLGDQDTYKLYAPSKEQYKIIEVNDYYYTCTLYSITQTNSVPSSKMYKATGSNEDGSMTQKAITEQISALNSALNNKASLYSNQTIEGNTNFIGDLQRDGVNVAKEYPWITKKATVTTTGDNTLYLSDYLDDYVPGAMYEIAFMCKLYSTSQTKVVVSSDVIPADSNTYALGMMNLSSYGRQNGCVGILPVSEYIKKDVIEGSIESCEFGILAYRRIY